MKTCQAFLLGLFTLVFCPLLHPLQAQDAAALIAQERERLEIIKAEADQLTQAAQQAASQGDLEQATTLYAQVLELLPPTPSWLIYRERTARSWLDAALTASQLQIANGNAQEAASTLQALAEHPLTRNNAELKLALENIQPVLEPAITPEFKTRVAQVTELLRLAESQFRTSQYEAAIESYNRVLLLDPFNSAAQRGLERITYAQEEFAQDAYNRSRGELLSDVTLGWELPVTENRERNLGAQNPIDLSDPKLPINQRRRLELRQTNLDRVDFANTPLTDALDIVRLLLRDQGLVIDFVVSDSQLEGRLLTLSLTQISGEDLLNFIAQQTKTSWNIDRGVVVFYSDGRGLRRFAQSYYLSPTVYRQLTLPSASASAPAGENPFSAVGTQVAQVSLEDILQQSGVEWDEASSAGYSQTTGLLNFSGTQAQHDQIQSILNDLQRKSGQQVRIELRLIRVTLSAEEELGFETLLGQFSLGGDRVFGGGGTPASGESGLPFNFPEVDPVLPVGQNLVSSGLRSGQEATGINTLAQIINNADAFNTTSFVQAPGIFSLGGVFSDPEFQLLMRGLNQRGGVDTMTKPSVITPNGQQASIQQIKEIIYPADYDPPEIPEIVQPQDGTLEGANNNESPPVIPAQPRDFTVDNEGVTLEVTPTISSDGNFINLEIRPELRFLDGFINYGTPINRSIVNDLGIATNQTLSENFILQPVFRSYNLSTRVTLGDGQSLVLGGLVRNDIISYDDKIPFLGDIPFLGRLFQTKGQQDLREAVIFVVNADILDISGQPINRRP